MEKFLIVFALTLVLGLTSTVLTEETTPKSECMCTMQWKPGF
jgi:hypothetical protein